MFSWKGLGGSNWRPGCSSLLFLLNLIIVNGITDSITKSSNSVDKVFNHDTFIVATVVKMFKKHWKSGLVARLIMMCSSGPSAALTIQLHCSTLDSLLLLFTPMHTHCILLVSSDMGSLHHCVAVQFVLQRSVATFSFFHSVQSHSVTISTQVGRHQISQ